MSSAANNLPVMSKLASIGHEEKKLHGVRKAGRLDKE